MNKKRLQILATVLEMSMKPKAAPKIGFNMIYYCAKNIGYPDRTQHNCGTTACIAGWAVAAFVSNVDADCLNHVSAHHISEQAREVLDLTASQAEALFCPPTSFRNEITPDEAAIVLRRLAATGEVTWGVYNNG